MIIILCIVFHLKTSDERMWEIEHNYELILCGWQPVFPGGSFVCKLFYFCVNTCQAPHLRMNPKHFTVPSVALFSASQQSQCAAVGCNSEWVTVVLHCTFFNTHWSDVLNYLVVNGWYHIKLLPSWCMFCVHHTAKHQLTVSVYSKPHT